MHINRRLAATILYGHLIGVIMHVKELIAVLLCVSIENMCVCCHRWLADVVAN